MQISTTPNCYYPLNPPDKATIDASGYVQGSDLRDTRGYERLVELLSKDRDTSTPATAQDRQEAQAAVDGMKLKAGTVLVAPCHAGYTAADRTAPPSTAQSGETSAPRSRRDIANDNTEEKTAASPTTGLWQHMFDAVAQFLAGVVHLAASNTATSLFASDKTPDDAGEPRPATDKSADKSREEAGNDIRDYERYLQAWSVSASA